MSDYSYYIVHTEPPKPKPSPRTWMESWFRTVRLWTTGTGADYSGEVVSRRPWEVRNGRVYSPRYGIDHTGCTFGYAERHGTDPCRCLTGRAR